MTIEPGWPVAFALAALLLLALGAHRVGGYGLDRSVLVAAMRALVQLTIIALVIEAVVDDLLLSAALVVVMFAVAGPHHRTAGRGRSRLGLGGPRRGRRLVPVLAVILASGAVPAEGIAIIPIAGIIVGNSMTAHTLGGRRSFAALRDEHSQYEACLALGLQPAQAIEEIIHRGRPRPCCPASTRCAPPAS